MRHLGILALLVLAACGGSGGTGGDPPGLDVGPPPSGAVYVQVVPVGTFSDDRLGEYNQVGADGQIRIREDVLANPAFAARVVCHELGHAIGLDHLTDPTCVMHTAGFTQTTPLCAQEASFAAAYAGPVLQVYVGLTPGLLDATTLAAERWNNVAGGTILDVQ